MVKENLQYSVVKKTKHVSIIGVATASNILTFFIYLVYHFKARHDMLQVITELSTSYGSQFLNTNGLMFNLNLGTPSWTNAELLFGQDTFLLTYIFVCKLIGIGPEITYLSFLVLVQISNSFFLYKTLKLLNSSIRNGIQLFLATTFLLSSLTFSLNTQGHGEIFIFRYFAPFVYICLLLLRSYNKRNVILFFFLFILQLSGYQGILSLSASMIFMLFQKESKLFFRKILFSWRYSLVFISCFIAVVLPLFITYLYVGEELELSVRTKSGAYSGGFAGFFLFPRIVHGGVYFPLTLGCIALYGLFWTRLNPPPTKTKPSGKPRIFPPVLLMTLLLSLKLGKPFGISKNGFQIPAETLLGNRNWGFLESPVTYLIYLNLSIVITNWISRDIKQTTNLRTLNWFTLVVALEIAFLAYNQNPLKVDQYRSIPWTQTSKFDFADKSRVFDTWIDSWPWVYNSGEFGKNNFLFTPVSFTQKSDIEKSRFKMKVANLEINAPNPLNPYTNWGSDVKKINILSLILGSTSDRPHFLQKLRLFTEEYKGKGFRFTEKFADGTIIIKDFPKTYIQEMTNLNRGGVPQRYLMIPKSTAHFLNSVEGEEGDSYVVDLLKRTPVFISNSISVVNNSNHLINSYNSGNIFPLEKTELREGHYRFSNLKEGCSFIISQNINTIRIESLLGCVGKNLVLRTAWSRNWKVSQGEASIAKISDFLLGIQIPKRTKQNDTIIVRYENTLYKYLVYIRFLIQISLFSWALYLSLSKRGKRFGILRR